MLKSFLCQGALYAKNRQSLSSSPYAKSKLRITCIIVFKELPGAVKSKFSSHRNNFLPLKWQAVVCMRGWPKETTWMSDREWMDGKKVLFKAPWDQGPHCQPGQWNNIDQWSKELPLQSSMLQLAQHNCSPRDSTQGLMGKGLSLMDPLEKWPWGPSWAAMLINWFTAVGHSSSFPWSTAGK